ncbi:MAG: hypothetical protein NVSMB51_12570 [Solirubrobacteraceae bacterium]
MNTRLQRRRRIRRTSWVGSAVLFALAWSGLYEQTSAGSDPRFARAAADRPAPSSALVAAGPAAADPPAAAATDPQSGQPLDFGVSPGGAPGAAEPAPQRTRQS